MDAALPSAVDLLQVAVATPADSSVRRLAWNRVSNGSIDSEVASQPSVIDADNWPALSESVKLPSKHPGLSTDPTKVGDGYVRRTSPESAGGGILENNRMVTPTSPPPPPAGQDRSSNCSHDQEGRGRQSVPHPRGTGSNQRRGFNSNRRGYHSGDLTINRHMGHESLNAYPRGFGGRPMHVLPPIPPEHLGMQPYIGAPPPPPIPEAYIHPLPPPLRPIGGSALRYPAELPSSQVYYMQLPPTHVPFHSMPFVARPVTSPPILRPSPFDAQRAELLKQVEYYFSSENLCKDIFLREKMDEQGWVPLDLIANFNRVKQLTGNGHVTDSIHFILETLCSSTVLEIQGNKIRRRNDWANWLLPRSADVSGDASGLAALSAAPQFQKFGKEPAHLSSD